jgi:hypothetical protein
MKKQLVIIGIVALLVSGGLSGCNQISNVFLTDKDRLVGTWDSEGIWLDVPTVIVFSSNGSFDVGFKLGIPLPIDFSFGKGKWDIREGILTMEIVDMIPPSNYTYQFSEDNKILTITSVDSSDSYILKKQ